MIRINSMFVSLFVLFILYYEINGQICTEHNVYTAQDVEYRNLTYFDKVKKCNWFNRDKSGCGEPQIKNYLHRVVITKRVVQVRHVCCEGYVRTDPGFDNERIDCQPSCVPGCTNGRCDSPGICSCYEGYMKDASDQHRCIPICNNGCEHGTCIQPNVCKCKLGYYNDNEICQPICIEPCHNGTCVAPDICECLVGFRKSERNTCQPYCYSGCEYGSCVSPDTCSCGEGWFLTENQRCVPLCQFECLNGRCVEQNICECFPGYDFNRGVCEPICKNCQGSCIGSYTCQCDSPFITVNLAADGEACDCFFNCTDEDIECEQTICQELSTVPVETIIDDEATEVPLQYTLIYGEITTSDNEAVMMENSNINQKQTRDNTESHMDWIVVTLVLCLLFLLAVLVFLVVTKWKYLSIYFKGSSYVVEDTRDGYQSSQFVNVPLSSVATKSISKN